MNARSIFVVRSVNPRSNRISGVCLAALLMLPACGAGPATEDDVERIQGALGSPDTTIIDISNLTQLNNIRNKLNGNYRLTADIDASTTSGWNGGKGWLPIVGFTGTLNGQGFKINSLRINRPNENNIGLFANTNQALLLNIGFSDAVIRGASTVGTLAGTIRDSSVVFTYVDQGTVTSDAGSSTGMNVGLLAGIVTGSSIRGSYTRGTVNGRANYIGGLAGAVTASSSAPSEIFDCYTRATVDASGSHPSVAGGIAGSLSSSRATNVWARGLVRGRGSVGGLIGAGTGTFWFDFSYSRNEVYDLDRSAASGGWGGTYGANTNDFASLHFGPLLWDSTVDGSTSFGGAAQGGHSTALLQAPTTPGGGVYANNGDAQWQGWAAGTSTQYHILINVVRPEQQRL